VTIVVKRYLRLSVGAQLILLIFLNFLDALFTIHFVGNKGIDEVNPVVSPLFLWGINTFLIWKMLLVCFCSAVLYLCYKCQERKWIVPFVRALIWIYAVLTVFHLLAFIFHS